MGVAEAATRAEDEVHQWRSLMLSLVAHWPIGEKLSREFKKLQLEHLGTILAALHEVGFSSEDKGADHGIRIGKSGNFPRQWFSGKIYSLYTVHIRWYRSE